MAALLHHEEFVRGLARSLVADRTAADDLAQDTWLAALRRPPAALGSMRGWLTQVMRNQLRNRRRGEVRQRARETAVARARDDADDSARETHDRLALQHQVVETVLGLREPFQTVLLLRYYEGLSAAQIARRRGVPPGTVRSQLSRGLEELRCKLDGQHAGGRGAWCALLLRFLDHAPMATATAAGAGIKVAAAAGLLVTAAIAIPASGLLDPKPHPAPHTGAVGMGAATNDLDRAQRPDKASATGKPSFSGAALPRRSAVPAAAAQDPNLEQKKLPELLDLAARIQALLRERLLTPTGDHVERELALLQDVQDTGTTRILRRETFEGTLNEPLGIRGGGAYFSFHLESHSYDDEPDLCLSNGQFSSCLYGGSTGYILDLGDAALDTLGTTAPQTLKAEQAPQWSHLWAAAGSGEGPHDTSFDTRARNLGLTGNAPARRGHTYVLRAILDAEHDILVAFRSVHSDRDGHTLVWRVLRTFGSWGKDVRTRQERPRGKVPKWLTKKTPEQLLDTLADIRALAEPLLLEVPEAFARRHRSFAAKDNQGICRLLHRGKFKSIVHSQGGGAYFSFVTEQHDYQAEVDLELQQNSYSSGFAGNDQGYLLDLGQLPLHHADRLPPGLDARGQRAWRFLQDMVSERSNSDGSFSISEDDRSVAQSLGLGRSVPGIVGHSYLLRSVQSRHDVLVVFATLAADDQGHTLLWRVLKRR